MVAEHFRQIVLKSCQGCANARCTEAVRDGAKGFVLSFTSEPNAQETARSLYLNCVNGFCMDGSSTLWGFVFPIGDLSWVKRSWSSFTMFLNDDIIDWDIFHKNEEWIIPNPLLCC